MSEKLIGGLLVLFLLRYMAAQHTIHVNLIIVITD